MTITRRNFIHRTTFVAAGAALGRRAFAHDMQPPVPSALDLGRLAKFVDPLPIPPRAITTRSGPGAAPHCRVVMRQVMSRVHRDLPPTRFWSFGQTFPGPTIEARRGEALSVEWVNALPASHFLPIDRTIHGAETDKPDTRAVVHVHGARVQPQFDGHPDHWIAPGASAVYHYANRQDATTLWYHDHTMGLNRLNVYAGLMGLYLIRDADEAALGLPAGPHEIPLLLCDRLFDTGAQLVYPTSDDPHAPWVPEVFGDALLINGKLLPYVDVEPRPYRFRIVNGSNGRFLNLSLSDRSMFEHIGSDQGLLDAIVPASHVELAPAERADVVVDFSGRQGAAITLDNDGVAAMQIRVSRTAATVQWTRPAKLRAVARLTESAATRTRTHSLGEATDLVKRPMMMLLNDTHWHMPVTEIAELDSTEIWNLVNVTDDSHPIHLHLVRFQILDRRKFDVFLFQNEGVVKYLGPALPPDAAEAGWKDTVRAHPAMVTRIIIRFEGYVGRYMWHCHILEHGDNEMMRPFDVVPARV